MATKRISINQLIPGMYLIEMDVPWYRTPFLSHKFSIKDRDTIQLMKRHGITMVTIDTSKGLDVPSSPSSTSPEDPAHSAPPQPASLESLPPIESLPPANTTPSGEAEVHKATQPPSVIYAQAQEAVERIFSDLERGIPPSPEATKAVVSTVLEQVLSNQTAMATQLAIQKIKQFDRSLTTHALDTCILSLIVALESGLDQPTQELVGMGALLHDTGYVRLPRNLVRRREECTGQDKTLLEQHCKLGVAVLAEQPGMPEEVMRIVREHHERGNGSGFPAGLHIDQTSTLAQIVGIVDFYDGMVSRHGARPSLMPHDAVRQLFLAGERGQFEKSLVELMIRSIGVYPVGSLVRLNTGEQAVVVGVNPQQRLKPLVKITTDPQGGSYPTPIEVDLAASSADHTVRSVLRVLDPTRERVNIGIHLDNSDLRAA
jgi:putative nucleotidyltransferase with HDIG domain